jgi:hypothetical protein
LILKSLACRAFFIVKSISIVVAALWHVDTPLHSEEYPKVTLALAT